MPPKPNRVINVITFDQTPEFIPSLVKFTKDNPKVLEKFELFKDIITKPPYVATALSDHKLSKRLAGFRDVHLSGDVILIFTFKNNVVGLIEVVNHDDIKPNSAKEKANAKKWAKHR